MDKEELLKRGHQRAEAAGLPYAGALTPTEAHALLAADPRAKLVDVRTRAEWEWVGRVPQATLIEWNDWPEGRRNPAFLDQLRAQVPDADAPVLFLCRSGARSHNAAAAAANAGYSHAFNVLEGFEGNRNASGQRSSVGGWRFAGLPWVQG
jgi:rhodanese-related sulfurtransferase